MNSAASNSLSVRYIPVTVHFASTRQRTECVPVVQYTFVVPDIAYRAQNLFQYLQTTQP